MFDREAEESGSRVPDSLANAMMPACHCGTAMKRTATAHCGAPEESSPRESGKDPEAGSD
jgi:hypothetical protein